jgi:prolycopene isomerase
VTERQPRDLDLGSASLSGPADVLPLSCDVTVIGGGLGGLTAAALLSKTGLRVCVLEKEERCGGYLAGFDRKGFHFETAIHWLNNCRPGSMTRSIFDFIAADAPVTPVAKRVRRYKNDHTDYLLTNRPDMLRDRLIADFPDEARAIKKFFRAAKVIGEAFPKLSSMFRDPDTLPRLSSVSRQLTSFPSLFPLLRYLPYSVEKGLTRTFNSRGLLQMFSAGDRLISCLAPIGWAYIHDFQLLPQGGSRAFPAWLAAVARRQGAVVACGCAVERIGLEGNRANRVVYTRNGVSHDLSSRYVVAACDIGTVYR